MSKAQDLDIVDPLEPRLAELEALVAQMAEAQNRMAQILHGMAQREISQMRAETKPSPIILPDRLRN